MTASEKLRALDVYHDEGWDSGPYDRNDEQRRADALLVALPQLVAVVEAAELIRLPNPIFFPEAYEGEAATIIPSCEALAAALAALDEVLP